jgi:transposase
MSKRIFTKEQINELLKNKNVARCSDKSITYHKDFKIEAVKQRDDGLSVREIFKKAGFNLDIIGRETPERRLGAWRKVFDKQGIDGLSKEARGGPGRRHSIKDLTDKERLKRLEAEVAYLKEENRFLAKLRKESLN